MGKDLKGKKLPTGIDQKDNGIYRGRFQCNGENYTIYNYDLKKLIVEMEDLRYEVRHELKRKGDSLSLNEWFDIWLNTHKKRTIKESTKVRYDDFYKRYVAKKIGHYKIVKLTPFLIENLLQGMADKDYSTKTIHDVYNIINAMCKYAVHNRIITFNPCSGVELPETKAKENRVLTVDEEKEILCHAKGHIHENLIKVALGTGLRGGEIRGLTWDDIDFKKREISVNKTLVYLKDLKTKEYSFVFQTPKTKNGTRIIPMSENVYKTLRNQRIQQKENQLKSQNWNPRKGFENLVFLGKNGEVVSESSFQATLNRLEQEINRERERIAKVQNKEYTPIPHFYPHSFRHTFATRCFEAGIDAKVIQGFLGHYSISITLDIYTHVVDDKARAEMDKLQEMYEKII